MTLRVQTCDSDKASWDAYVRAQGHAVNYHRFGWKEVIEKSFGHRTYYLSVRDRQGTIRGVLPLVYMSSSLFGRFLVSIPFVNYGGLLCEDDQAAEALLKEAHAILQELVADHLELRHVDAVSGGLATKRHKVTMILDLAGDVETQWNGFNAKLRNQIRKPLKNGLEAVSGHAELLDGFYDVFARNMRDLGTPVYGKEFFANVLAAFPDTTRIFAVRLKGKIIAAGLASWFNETFEIPWASSVGAYKSLCPNNLLYWEAIKFAIENGFGKFDFGRSTPGEGTFRFKEQWGARQVQLNWQYVMRGGGTLPELNPKNPKYRLAIGIWRKLPVGLTRMIGPMIVRNIP